MRVNGGRAALRPADPSGSLRAMQVFVTGARGFVGRRLAPRIEERGWSAVLRDQELDVTDLVALTAALEETLPDAIVHLAAMSSVAQSFGDPAGVFRVNFLGSRNLLVAAARAVPAARVLLIGSADEYGRRTPGDAPLREDEPLAPASPYARTKAAAELLGLHALEHGQDVVCVRAFGHTGPGQAPHFVAPSFARQVAEIEAGRREPRMRVGNLLTVRDFLHVDDVVDAYLRLLDPSVPADVYSVASGRGVEIRALLDGLVARAGIAPEVEADPSLVRPTDALVGDASRLRERTGWTPRFDFAALCDALLDDWRERTGRAA